MKRIEIYENGINIVFEITDENEAKLLHFSALPFDEAKTASYMGLKTFRPVEIQASGIDRPDERHGNKYIVTAPGWRMKFKDFRDVNNDHGRKLELVTFDECFLTNSLMGIMPLFQIENVAFKERTVTNQLRKSYLEMYVNHPGM